ncbi:MAG: hypothetical protein AAF615_02020 [Pseudomonadota bacterium]
MRRFRRLFVAFASLALVAASVAVLSAGSSREAVALVQSLYDVQDRMVRSSGYSIFASEGTTARYFAKRYVGRIDPRSLGFDPLYGSRNRTVSELIVAPQSPGAFVDGAYFVTVRVTAGGTPHRLTYTLRDVGPQRALRIVDIRGSGWRLSQLVR